MKEKQIFYDRIGPANPSQLEVNEILEYYQKGRYDLTEILAKGLTQKYPSHQLAWKILGIIFKRTGRLEESLAVNQKAIDLSPNDSEAHSNLGTTLRELGRLKEAETSYKRKTLRKVITTWELLCKNLGASRRLS